MARGKLLNEHGCIALLNNELSLKRSPTSLAAFLGTDFNEIYGITCMCKLEMQLLFVVTTDIGDNTIAFKFLPKCGGVL